MVRGESLSLVFSVRFQPGSEILSVADYTHRTSLHGATLQRAPSEMP